jgi:ABC-type maltose transport system permease subunit
MRAWQCGTAAEEMLWGSLASRAAYAFSEMRFTDRRTGLLAAFAPDVFGIFA